jgi:hypothetical protein
MLIEQGLKGLVAELLLDRLIQKEEGDQLDTANAALSATMLA